MSATRVCRDSEQPVQPSCLLVRVAGQATPAPASTVQQPERFPLTVEPDTIEFPPDQRAVKLTINNKTRVDYEVTTNVTRGAGNGVGRSLCNGNYFLEVNYTINYRGFVRFVSFL